MSNIEITCHRMLAPRLPIKIYMHNVSEILRFVQFHYNSPDFRFSVITNDFVRLTRSERLRNERNSCSGIRIFGLSGALRSGINQFLTANIVRASHLPRENITILL